MAKEAYPYILFLSVFLIVAAILEIYIAIGLFALLLLFVIYFFRDPERTIPVDINFPFKGEVAMSIEGMHFKLRENALVDLPTLNIPIRCHVEAKLDLEKNLQLLEKLIAKKD